MQSILEDNYKLDDPDQNPMSGKYFEADLKHLQGLNDEESDESEVGPSVVYLMQASDDDENDI